MIVILFTGGTITMRNDPGGGGTQPGLTAAEIMQATLRLLGVPHDAPLEPLEQPLRDEAREST